MLKLRRNLTIILLVSGTLIYERAKFNYRCQKEGEAVDLFITDLHAMAECCKYGIMKNELIRDRIVVGIRDT